MVILTNVYIISQEIIIIVKSLYLSLLVEIGRGAPLVIIGVTLTKNRHMKKVIKERTNRDNTNTSKCCWNECNDVRVNSGYCRYHGALYQRAYKYGLTIDELEDKLNQSNNCEICNTSLVDKVKHIDHNHTLSKGDNKYVRGVLCNHCNTGLGKVYDSIPILESMIRYLTKYN